MVDLKFNQDYQDSWYSTVMIKTCAVGGFPASQTKGSRGIFMEAKHTVTSLEN